MPHIDRRQFVLGGATAPFWLSATTSATEIDSPIAFATREIAAASSERIAVSFGIDPTLGEQAYRIAGYPGDIRVTAGDDAGAMYAGLDIAEAARSGTAYVSALVARGGVRKPYIPNRGVKFNIPLDMRNPSYADGGDSNRANIGEVWERQFWADYFDEMARQRFNTMTIWNLHPFPSMVKVPEFPDVALNDVWRPTAALGPGVQETRGRNLLTEQGLAHHEVVKTITIDEKIAFWREVMEMARRRGIKFYVFTWNIYTYGAFGRYGITDAIDNPATVAYVRASVRELVKTYPLLAGIGITAGENMNSTYKPAEREQWLWSTYGEGVRDALNALPGRTLQLIHRFHETSGATINRVWGQYPGYPESFTFSHKYSIAHMYSTPRPPFFEREARRALDGKRAWLELRNDDIHSLRWGDPEFAREYILNMPQPDMAGFNMGADGFCWGRDFMDRKLSHRKLGARRPLVIQKHWYAFALWGRLAYDPTLKNAFYVRMLAQRFPGVNAQRLFDAARFASQVVPQTSCFFWRDIDLQWLPEACSRNSRWAVGVNIEPYDKPDTGAAFYTVKDFMRGSCAPGVDILNIRKWRARLIAGQAITEATPIEVADGISGSAEQALLAIADVRRTLPRRATPELQQTIGDFEAMSYLGRYYAAKIRGACQLALFDLSGAEADRQTAIEQLEIALTAWRRYAEIHSAQYLPNFFSRIGFVDVKALTAEAGKDIDIAKEWTPGSLV